MTVTSEERSESTDGGPARDTRVAFPPAAFATQRLCPYLVADGSEWRSASPSRDHRCGAVVPPVPLALDKQRRLCLTHRHVGCPTYVAAVEHAGRAGAGDGPDDPLPDPRAAGTRPGGAAVTRWGIVRTVPVRLDRGRFPGPVASLFRSRTSPQLALVALLVVAFVVIAAARLSGGGPATTGAKASGSAVALGIPSAEPSIEPPASPVTTNPSPSATLPPTTAARTYRVKRGDTLYVLARRFGTTVGTLQRLNGMGSSTTLHAGQVLKLP